MESRVDELTEHHRGLVHSGLDTFLPGERKL